MAENLSSVLSAITFTNLWADSADDTIDNIFCSFLQIVDFDISCKLPSLGKISSQTSVAQTFLGPWKFVLDVCSLSH